MKDFSIEALNVDRDIFTVDDAREALYNVMKSQIDDFYELKNEKWYKSLLSAITFGSDKKKIIVKNIRNLSELQKIVVEVYAKFFSVQDEQIATLGEQIKELTVDNAIANKFVMDMYYSTVLGLKKTSFLNDLEDFEWDIFVLLLREYKSQNNRENILRDYRASIVESNSKLVTESPFDVSLLEKVSNAGVFYRSLVEMWMLDETEEMPDKMIDYIDYLDIGKKSKERILESVKREIEDFGLSYLLCKYKKNTYDIDLCEAEYEIEEICDAMVDLETEIVDCSVDDSKTVEVSKKQCDEHMVEWKVLSCDSNEPLEEVYLSSIINVKSGETLLFENKIVHIHTNIICEGEIIFNNCKIYYNEEDSGSIRLKNDDSEASLVIQNSEIVCCKYSNTFFIFDNELGKIHNIDIYNNKFYECNYFINVCKANLRFENNYICDSLGEIIDIGQLSSLSFVNNEICTNNSSFGTAEDFFNKLCIEFFNLLVEENGIGRIENIKFVLGDYFNELINKAIIMDRLFVTNVKIVNSVFEGIEGTINSNDICDFENCVFVKCSKFIATSNGKFINCRFMDCSRINCEGCTFSGCYFQGACGSFEACVSDKSSMFESCEFKDITYNGAWGLFCFQFNDDKEDKTITINNCVFDNIAVRRYLVEVICDHKTNDRPVVYINNSLFKKCSTTSKDGEIILRKGTYDKIFKKNIPCTYTVVKGCRGLDNISIIPALEEHNDIDDLLSDPLAQKKYYKLLDLKKHGLVTEEEYQINIEKIVADAKKS